MQVWLIIIIVISFFISLLFWTLIFIFLIQIIKYFKLKNAKLKIELDELKQKYNKTNFNNNIKLLEFSIDKLNENDEDYEEETEWL